MLSFEDLCALVARLANVDVSKIGPDALLSGDLGLDSFALLELWTALAEAGAELPEADWVAAGTVGELHARCSRQLTPVPSDRRAGEAGEAEGLIGSVLGAYGGSGPEPGRGGFAGLAGPGPRGPLDPAAPEAPQRVGRFFRLTPVLPGAVPFLYDLAISPETGFRWRYRGAVPPYPQFEQELWQGMLAQFVVETVGSGDPVGQVICYNPDMMLGVAYVGAAMTDRYAGSGIALEPVRLFVRYVFDVWPFRKLYLEMPEYNFRQFASVTADKRARVEGRFVDHDYYRGRHWDRIILALYRDDPVTAGPSGPADGDGA